MPTLVYRAEGKKKKKTLKHRSTLPGPPVLSLPLPVISTSTRPHNMGNTSTTVNILLTHPLRCFPRQPSSSFPFFLSFPSIVYSSQLINSNNMELITHHPRNQGRKERGTKKTKGKKKKKESGFSSFTLPLFFFFFFFLSRHTVNWQCYAYGTLPLWLLYA
ncbi:hypothetical protein L873DRAFT_425273 [Choiromyces venosus 120613-1]|uniref:Uncharacterized protein n=1 Tax=Choiromyces venosus 120613-1 TaxID=1336337 RepID=A0A3N4JWR0_9PEZI|nr:hypothetical protein L873DRAFT_425273 [Choiromyces venosus 120613-1]